MNLTKPALAVAAATVVLQGSTQAATLSLTTPDSTYTQNFDALGTAGGTQDTLNTSLPGLEFSGTGINSYSANTGTTTSGGVYNSSNTASSTDRAFGALTTNSTAPINLGFNFTNNTGRVITGLTVGYTGEQYRFGGAANRPTPPNDRVDFQYSTSATSLSSGTYTDVDSLDFVAPVASGTAGELNGNAASNRTVFAPRPLSATPLNITNGQQFFIRFADFNVAGTDDLLAIDDFSLQITNAPPPGNNTTITASPSSVLVADGRPILVGTTGNPNATATVNLSKTGSDTTTFTTTATGQATVTPASGSFAGGTQSQAIAAGVSTATAGAKSGSVVVDNTAATSAGANQGSADPNDTVAVSGTVVDASDAVIVTGATSSDSIILDLGTIEQNAGDATALFSLRNLVATMGFTAALDFDSFSTSDDTAALGTDLEVFQELAAGQSRQFSATLRDDLIGAFSETITLNFTNANNVVGGQTPQTATLTLTGSVVAAAPIPEPLAAMGGVALLGATLLPRRKPVA